MFKINFSEAKKLLLTASVATLFLSFGIMSCKGGGNAGGGIQTTDSVNPPVVATPPGPAGAGTGDGGLGKGPAPVILGMAGNFAILASSGISTIPGSAITGNIGVSPAAASYMTGFSLAAPPTSYSTSTQVTGQVFAADYDPPTPSNMTTSVLDMGTAFTDAAGRAADYNELATGGIGGMTLLPAVYKWSTGVLIASDLVLSGGPNDVWIFQIAGDLTMSSGIRITLAGGALAKNIFWQVSGAADLGTTSHFEGILLSQTAIVLKTGASANGRLLAQTAVNLDQNVVVQP